MVYSAITGFVYLPYEPFWSLKTYVVLAADFDPAGGVVNYTSAVSNATFSFWPLALGQAEAEGRCNARGSRLASYSSYEEQFDVEQWFMAQVGRVKKGLCGKIRC